jgi:atlastin
VRDWNFSQEIKYGLSGGKKYITNKLSVKNTQSVKSKRARELINKCFEEVSCYLMPKHVVEEEGVFTGSVAQLNPDFVKKMKELFSVFFDPESLDVKVISGLQITGRDLLKYFESYIEIFNSDKLNPEDLLEVTAKATDYKIIFDLKVKQKIFWLSKC